MSFLRIVRFMPSRSLRASVKAKNVPRLPAKAPLLLSNQENIENAAFLRVRTNKRSVVGMATACQSMFISSNVWQDHNTTYGAAIHTTRRTIQIAIPRVAFCRNYGRVSIRRVLGTSSHRAGHCDCRTDTQRRRVFSLASNNDERGTRYNLGRTLAHCRADGTRSPVIHHSAHGTGSQHGGSTTATTQRSVSRTIVLRGENCLCSPCMTTGNRRRAKRANSSVSRLGILSDPQSKAELSAG